MWIVRLALRRPYTICVAAITIILLGLMAMTSMLVDMFPSIDIPIVAAVWSYPGLSAEEMERRVVLFYERSLSAAVDGVEKIESQSIPGIGIVRVYLQQGTDLGMAVSQISATAPGILRVLPPGIIPPYILQYSASSVPIGQLTLSSDSVPEEQIYDYAFNSLRVQIFSIPGISIPLPYGGKSRQIIIDVNPPKLSANGLSTSDVVNALQASNLILPAGTARIGDLEYSVSINSSPGSIEQFNNIPIRGTKSSSMNIGDIAHVSDAFAVQTNMVRVNSKRATYINLLKKGGASTLAIIDAVKIFLPTLRKLAPKGINLNIDFDQSVFVRSAINNVVVEAVISSVLVSLMILVFLGSWSSMIVVCTSIPLAILSAIFCLKITGNSINVMTLGGLSLAIGMLVDDATVEVENIHRNRLLGLSLTDAILTGAKQIALPAIMATLAICIVFFPVILLTGPAHFLFTPMALAVVFAMLASYVLSRTLVPLLCSQLLGKESHDPTQTKSIFNRMFDYCQNIYVNILETILQHRIFVLSIFATVVVLSGFLAVHIGTDFFPQNDTGLIKLHFRAPVGTRIEVTEQLVEKIENYIRAIIPANELETINAMLGVPSSTTLAYVSTENIGGMDAEILIDLKPKHHATSGYVKLIRAKLADEFPDASVFFQSADMINQILNFGLSAPIDVQIEGSNFSTSYDFAKKLRDKIRAIAGTADVGIKQVFDYPNLKINVDRVRAAQMGFSQRDISNNLLISLSSSATLSPSLYLNPVNNSSYSVAVKIPLDKFNSIGDLLAIPITSGSEILGDRDISKTGFGREWNGSSIHPQRLGNLVSLTSSTTMMSINHYNIQRVVNITANVEGRDLGAVVSDIRKDISSLGELPVGTKISIRGQGEVMQESFKTLGWGLILSVFLVYLLMVVLFQSWIDPFIVLVAVPGAMVGIVWMLFITKTTFNVESFMGAIMAVGIAASNSILLVSFTNDLRIEKALSLTEAILEAGRTRLRPILMTALAMIFGMLPAALGLGEGAEQNAPLGRAVIGGLLVASFITIFIVPIVYCMLRKKLPTKHLLDMKFKSEELG